MRGIPRKPLHRMNSLDNQEPYSRNNASPLRITVAVSYITRHDAVIEYTIVAKGMMRGLYARELPHRRAFSR